MPHSDSLQIGRPHARSPRQGGLMSAPLAPIGLRSTYEGRHLDALQARRRRLWKASMYGRLDNLSCGAALDGQSSCPGNGEGSAAALLDAAFTGTEAAAADGQVDRA